MYHDANTFLYRHLYPKPCRTLTLTLAQNGKLPQTVQHTLHGTLILIRTLTLTRASTRTLTLTLFRSLTCALNRAVA